VRNCSAHHARARCAFLPPVPVCCPQCASGSLQDLLRLDGTKPAFTLGVRSRLAGELCDALTHIHAANVVHRDLKASGVVLTVAADLALGVLTWKPCKH